VRLKRWRMRKRSLSRLSTVYSRVLVNGPFSIILGWKDGMIALNDRLKLRSLVAAENDEFVYVASEEAAIRAVCPEPDKLWAPRGGEPVVALVDRSVKV